MRAQSSNDGIAIGGELAGKAVYRIVCADTNNYGTAWGHRSGRILTAEHVIRGCNIKQLVILDSTGAKTAVESIESDDDLDLALLRPSVGGFVQEGFTVTDRPTFKVGEPVSTWGFPEGYSGKRSLVSGGYISGFQSEKSKSGRTITKWVVNGAFNHGNSGGPVLELKNAGVIGIVTSKLTPFQDKLAEQLSLLEKGSSANERLLINSIQILQHNMQIAIGFCTMTSDLKVFLKSKHINP